MAISKLKVAVAGLGRMGKRHAMHLLARTPRADLVAAFTPDASELEWGRANLAPYGVQIFDDYDEMLGLDGLQAVCIATATTVHAEETIKAIDKDLHVLCEKPLSTSVDVSRTVVEAARKKPHLKVMCGFSRRFDASYRDAFEKMENGVIGRPSVFRSQTCDKRDRSGFFVEYAKFSGGCFVDMSVHDIDLALWFFGGDSVVKSVAASGIRAVSPGLEQHGDYDNAIGVVEFYGGKVAYFFCSRMMAHGQEDATEIIGTEGKLSVNANPQANLVNIYTPAGVSREVPPHYYGRFEHAFVQEANEWTTACLEDSKLPMKLSGALRAVEIGSYLQEAVRTGKKLYFDETGNRVERSSL